eukprot:scaffold16267_cov23-Cyclotella_meneghiniana.AAC.3
MPKNKRINNRALDIGCAVGGSAFELSTSFQHVEAFDYRCIYQTHAPYSSELFIQTARIMQQEHKVFFKLPMEGDICEHATAVLPILNPSCTNSNFGSIRFFVGDACNMPSIQQLGTFDAILCSNLLCRLPDPMAFLGALPNYLNIGGVVLFVSPYSWLEEYTLSSS